MQVQGAALRACNALRNNLTLGVRATLDSYTFDS